MRGDMVSIQCSLSLLFRTARCGILYPVPWLSEVHVFFESATEKQCIHDGCCNFAFLNCKYGNIRFLPALHLRGHASHPWRNLDWSFLAALHLFSIHSVCMCVVKGHFFVCAGAWVNMKSRTHKRGAGTTLCPWKARKTRKPFTLTHRLLSVC